MLPFNLLIARSRAGKIRPVYVPVDSHHLSLASELTKVFQEVVGFWTEDYLAKKIQKLKEVHARNMIVAVDRALSCSRFRQLKMELIFYENEIPVKPIIDYLRGIEEESVAKQMEALASAELRLQGDVISLGTEGAASDIDGGP